MEQVPLGAQFVVDGFFWLQVAGGGTGRQRVAVGSFAYQATGWRGRCGIRGVDAGVLHRLPHQAGLPVEELTVVLDLGAPGDGVGVGFGVKGVVAQPHVQQPFRIELNGVEHVRGAAGGLGVGTVVVARDAAVPGVVRVRVAQRRALAAQAALGRCAHRVGVRADGVAADTGFFAGKFQAGGVSVLEAQGLEAAKQIGLVGGCGRGGDTAVGATPDGAVAVDVELAVIRLSEHIVLAGAAVAQGVLERDVVVQVVFDGERADVRTGLAEVTAFQTVEVVAVAAVVGFVMHVGCSGRRTVAVGNPRIRQVITFHMVVAEVDTGRCAQAKSQRRRNAPTVVIHRVAAGHVLFMAHQVQAECRAVVQELAVHVEHVAAGLVGAVGKAAVGEVPRLWGLAHQVEAATG